MNVPGTLRDLVQAVATGRDTPPSVATRRGRSARRFAALRSALPVLTPIVALLLALAAYASLEPYHVGVPVKLIMAVLSALPLVLVRDRSLVAWRVAWLTAVISGFRYLYESGIFWPANPVAILVFLFVLIVVGYRQPSGVVFWVWLLSVTVVWMFTGTSRVPVVGPCSLPGRPCVGPSNSGAAIGGTLLITFLLLLGHLARRWAQARTHLAAEQERGAVLTERARIAREMHDVVAHHMSLIAVRAETAQYRLSELPETARDEFTEISKASREALTEMRRLLGVLRSEGERAPVAPQPGLADLSALVDTARAAGTPVELRVEGELTGIPVAADVSAYRIVQESLSNTARHAAGAPVVLLVRRGADDLLIQVRNGPGQAGPAAAPGEAGQGVLGMRERAAMLGGQLLAHPTGDGGFEVRAILPLCRADSGREA